METARPGLWRRLKSGAQWASCTQIRSSLIVSLKLECHACGLRGKDQIVKSSQEVAHAVESMLVSAWVRWECNVLAR